MNPAEGGAPPSFGADRDWLLRFAPPAQAAALEALLVVEHEVLASLRPGLEHQIAHLRLEWWHDELSRLAAGAPRHPSTRALATAAQARTASPPMLTGLVEHARVDLATVAFLSRDELDQHLGNWAVSVFREAALGHPEIDGTTSELRAAAERLAAGAGRVVRELELLADFGRHARAGRIYLPLGEPPQPHQRWLASPLAAPETAELQRRQQQLAGVLRQTAQTVEPRHRHALRVPLLWMAFSARGAATAQAPRSPLRRTMAAWRDALAVSRGRLPQALR